MSNTREARKEKLLLKPKPSVDTKEVPGDVCQAMGSILMPGFMRCE